LPPSLFDPLALETAAIITQSRQDGMPAEFNVFGEEAIAGALMESVAKPVLEAVTGGKTKRVTNAEPAPVDNTDTTPTLAAEVEEKPVPAPRKPKRDWTKGGIVDGRTGKFTPHRAKTPKKGRSGRSTPGRNRRQDQTARILNTVVNKLERLEMTQRRANRSQRRGGRSKSPARRPRGTRHSRGGRRN